MSRTIDDQKYPQLKRELLTDLIESRKLNYTTFGKRVGVSGSLISKICTGKRGISKDFSRKIFDFLQHRESFFNIAKVESWYIVDDTCIDRVNAVFNTTEGQVELQFSVSDFITLREQILRY